jgi:hypothetical protein
MKPAKPVEVVVDEENVSTGKKWKHSTVELQLPEGWQLDYSWSRGGTHAEVYGDGRKIVVGVRKLIDD